MKKKLLAMLLLSAMLLSAFAGCSEGGENTDETTAADPSTPAAEETVVEEEEDTLESAAAQYADRDYGGYEYRVADRGDPGTYADWQTFDVYAAEQTGEIINDAVYQRNTTLEETMNIKIAERPFTHGEVTNSVKNSIMASSDDYDVFTDGLSTMAPLVSQNYILDLRTIDTLKFDNAWWDQMIYKDLSIMNKSFFMTGDLSVMDNYGTWCYLFNKTMIADFGLENPYELVDSGKWTIDKHNEMASAATVDLDGDGAWTMADSYGYITETYNNMAMWNCFGYRLVTKDADDVPTYTYNGEEQITALQKIIETQFSPFTNMGSGSTVTGGGGLTENTRENQFAIGRALFYYAGLRNVTLYRDSDTDFGIIPSPKYKEEQEQYYSSYSYANCTAYAMPVTVADTAKIGDITEAMAHLSVYTLTPAYYDKTLIGKSTRDQESAPMLDLILATRNYDLGNIFAWGGVSSAIYSMSDPNTVASSLQKLEKAANKVLQRFIDDLSEMEP
ncbi:MAG: hypothetical protein E7579_08735 [Ruminococcaceae bacterium]|nr:hypothetical protein [Oscillospiraceae bacterium]